jgi:hypothetical protein
MPSKSPAQRRFMSAAAHNPEFAAKAGIPQSVAQDFHNKDRGKWGAMTASGKKKPVEPAKPRIWGQMGG